jgi:hypothetical protein
MVGFGMLLQRRGATAEAEQWCRRSANQGGHAVAMFNLQSCWRSAASWQTPSAGTGKLQRRKIQNGVASRAAAAIAVLERISRPH